MAKKKPKSEPVPAVVGYDGLLSGISEMLEQARRATVRVVNSTMTAAYWEIGRRIVEHEQRGEARAEYGEELLLRLGRDLTARFGRGFADRSLRKMRAFYLGWEIWPTPSANLQAKVKFQTVSGKSTQAIWPTPLAKSESEISPTPSAKLQARVKWQTVSADSGAEKAQTVSALSESKILPTLSAKLQPITPHQLPLDPTQSLTDVFPLPWSHYVRLMSVRNEQARAFYEAEAIRGGWSVRQLDRQIGTQFYERAAASRNRAAMLEKGQQPRPEDAVTVEETLRDPYLLEFLNLKDEYTEEELENALIQHLETFLLELGIGFTFVARQKRILIGGEWYRMDLVLFHRLLRCLVIIDLKIGKFTHADAGQINLYLNYAKEHLLMPSEADPVGLILCTEKDDAVVHYALGGIQAKVFAAKYLTALPGEETLRREVLATRHALETRAAARDTFFDSR